ncbi:MAG: L-ribulose-5-phosphate 3-epimerase [Chitinivibrionales bacterium]|nr:L-ribulose-5-phosphate 3-epimerase [Chitinivibrionales bacterium]
MIAACTAPFSLGLYEKAMPHTLPIPQKLVETQLAGFDFMEISIDESDEKLARLNWNRAERAAVRRATEETGLSALTMCLSAHRKYPLGSEHDSVRSHSLEIMARAIELAIDLGIRIIQLAGYDEYYRPSTSRTRRLFGDNLCRCVDMAARKGVVLAFETMETEFMNTVGKAMTHVRQVDSPWLQVYPDLGNITNAAVQYGSTVHDDLVTGKGRLAAMHLKETVPGKFREIPYGTGHVDFRNGIRTARACGINLFVGEFWYTGEPEWRNTLHHAHRFLTSNFEEPIQNAIGLAHEALAPRNQSSPGR